MFLIPPVITHASSIGMTFMTKWQSFEEEIIIVLIYFMVPTVPGAVMGNSLCNLTPKTNYCCCSVAQSCSTLCDTMDGSMPGFSALHSLLGFVKSTFMESVMLTISSSIVPFSSCPQSFPASVSFPMSWLFLSGVHRIRDSASAPDLPMNIQGRLISFKTSLIFLLSKGLSRVFSSTTV